MPNYVKNIVRFGKNVPQERIDELFGTILSTRDPKGGDPVKPWFDFDALIPMPEALNIDSGSDNETGILLYQLTQAKLPDSINGDRLAAYMRRNGLSLETPGSIPAFLATKDGKRLHDLGRRCVENLRLYGAPTWYEWRSEHWGTKWNSCNSQIDAADRTVSFSTAWAAPMPIAEALVERFPDVGFAWTYASEDIGYDAGRIASADGKLKIEEFEGGSNEAYTAYVECWGTSKCLYRDENGAWQHYDCDTCPHPC